MYKKTVTYTDYNGVERKEDFYFNLSKAELMEMQMTTPGGMSEMLNRIVEAKEDVEIMKTFKRLMLASYGEKSPDGKHFKKSKELSEAFEHTVAYSEIFVELASDSNAAAEFIKGIVPKDLQNELETVSIAPIAE